MKLNIFHHFKKNDDLKINSHVYLERRHEAIYEEGDMMTSAPPEETFIDLETIKKLEKKRNEKKMPPPIPEEALLEDLTDELEDVDEPSKEQIIDREVLQAVDDLKLDIQKRIQEFTKKKLLTEKNKSKINTMYDQAIQPNLSPSESYKKLQKIDLDLDKILSVIESTKKWATELRGTLKEEEEQKRKKIKEAEEAKKAEEQEWEEKLAQAKERVRKAESPEAKVPRHRPVIDTKIGGRDPLLGTRTTEYGRAKAPRGPKKVGLPPLEAPIDIFDEEPTNRDLEINKIPDLTSSERTPRFTAPTERMRSTGPSGLPGMVTEKKPARRDVSVGLPQEDTSMQPQPIKKPGFFKRIFGGLFGK